MSPQEVYQLMLDCNIVFARNIVTQTQVKLEFDGKAFKAKFLDGGCEGYISSLKDYKDFSLEKR